MFDVLENFLALEPMLVARLREKVPELVDVMSMADLDGIPERSQRTPCGFVGLGEYRVTEVRANGERAAIQQEWEVLIAVRNARAQQDTEINRQEAGPLLAKALRVLQGWKPDAYHSALEPISSAYAPTYRDGGMAYFPLAFTTTVKSYSSEE